MSPAVTCAAPPGTTPAVYRVVARGLEGSPEQAHRTWATLTLTGPADGFANVCISGRMELPERRRFLGAVVDVAAALGACRLVVVLETCDVPLVPGSGCEVLTSTAIGPTSLLHVSLPSVPAGPRPATPPAPGGAIQVERLPPPEGRHVPARPSRSDDLAHVGGLRVAIVLAGEG